MLVPWVGVHPSKLKLSRNGELCFVQLVFVRSGLACQSLYNFAGCLMWDLVQRNAVILWRSERCLVSASRLILYLPEGGSSSSSLLRAPGLLPLSGSSKSSLTASWLTPLSSLAPARFYHLTPLVGDIFSWNHNLRFFFTKHQYLW